MEKEKRYIGDGIYVAYDGYALVLTTEDGISATNTIALEPEIWHSLDEYVTEIKSHEGPRL